MQSYSERAEWGLVPDEWPDVVGDAPSLCGYAPHEIEEYNRDMARFLESGTGEPEQNMETRADQIKTCLSLLNGTITLEEGRQSKTPTDDSYIAELHERRVRLEQELALQNEPLEECAICSYGFSAKFEGIVCPGCVNSEGDREWAEALATETGGEELC
jgi:hypothetical protein